MSVDRSLYAAQTILRLQFWVGDKSGVDRLSPPPSPHPPKLTAFYKQFLWLRFSHQSVKISG